jgi:IS5 family transposase
MALGVAVVQQRFESPGEILGDRLREGSLYRLLADHGDRLFPDDYFADLFKESARGRPTVPARVLATVMVLQAHEGLSDREATDRLEVDLRWQAAAGVDAGAEAFHPTVLVGQRNRLRASSRPRRLFEDSKVVARQAGVLHGRARVLDSTPLFDAVATQDTVTQLRAVIRKLLMVLDSTAPALAARVRAVLSRDDDYVTAGKPPCDWDDPAARQVLVDELVHDALAALAVLDGVTLTGAARDAADLLALVAGQDVAEGDDGVFRIVRGVARDRVISTVDPEARHGHKSQNRRFDGYKTHVSIDPDSELIDEATVTPANTPDRDVVDDLLAPSADEPDKPEVVGDSAYADGETRERLGNAGYTVRAKVPSARNREGRFTKDRFHVNLDDETVTCPAGQTATITWSRRGGGKASFKPHCRTCPLRSRCTAARRGRSISIHRHEALLQV